MTIVICFSHNLSNELSSVENNILSKDKFKSKKLSDEVNQPGGNDDGTENEAEFYDPSG